MYILSVAVFIDASEKVEGSLSCMEIEREKGYELMLHMLHIKRAKHNYALQKMLLQRSTKLLKRLLKMTNSLITTTTTIATIIEQKNYLIHASLYVSKMDIIIFV